MSDTPTPETDKAEDYDPMVEGEWHWIVPSSFARRLERERDEARRERDEALKECVLAQVGWSEALKQRDEARRELVIQKYELMRVQKELIETQIKLRERLAAVTHPYKNEQKEEA